MDLPSHRGSFGRFWNLSIMRDEIDTGKRSDRKIRPSYPSLQSVALDRASHCLDDPRPAAFGHISVFVERAGKPEV
jgi:hypothetical protein